MPTALAVRKVCRFQLGAMWGAEMIWFGIRESLQEAVLGTQTWIFHGTNQEIPSMEISKPMSMSGLPRGTKDCVLPLLGKESSKQLQVAP